MAFGDLLNDLRACLKLGNTMPTRGRLCLWTVLSRNPQVWSPSRQAAFAADITSHGKRLQVYLRNNGSDIQVFTTVFYRGEYRVPELDWEELETIVDAGANIGVSSLLFSVLAPKARIIAVEPEPSNVGLLERNVKANNIRAEVVPAALWHTTGRISLTLQASAMSHSVVAGRQCSPGAHEVCCLDMATLLDQRDIGHLDLLKCDIEGAECEVLRNSDHWIHRVKYIILEAHSAKGCPSAKVCDILRNNGFATRKYCNNDGLIFAWRKA